MFGHELVVESLKIHGVEAIFYLLSGPTIHYVQGAMDQGIRGIDVRHEQAAALMAQGYTRVTRKVGVCTAGSGPGTINLMTGVATAWWDAMPMLVLGGSSPMGDYEKGAFHDIDQISLMRPITKWQARVHDPHRIPEYIKMALQRAVSGRPGPVYLDLPADMLYDEVDPGKVRRPLAPVVRTRYAPNPEQLRPAVDRLLAAKRPIILSGSGAILAEAGPALQNLAETLGIPVYTTPQGRGILPDDHPLCLMGARSRAFRTADTVLVVGTRLNYVSRYLEPPHFDPDAVVIQVEVDPMEVGQSPRVNIPVGGDAALVLAQLLQELQTRKERPNCDQGWLREMTERHQRKSAEVAGYGDLNQEPIHPLRLCHELSQLLPRDAVLTVDGQEILNFGRQSIPTFVAGHRMNSGPFGCIGIGVPLAIGAKVGAPDKLVVALSGDGSFGMNGFELDTAVRHHLPFLTVISNNGGWTSNQKRLPGRDLGFTRYDAMFQPLGCHTSYVTQPSEIRPALVAALDACARGQVALVNVITDPAAKAFTAPFSGHPGMAKLDAEV